MGFLDLPPQWRYNREHHPNTRFLGRYRKIDLYVRAIAGRTAFRAVYGDDCVQPLWTGYANQEAERRFKIMFTEEIA